MKKNQFDLPQYVTSFFSDYLVKQIHMSPNTILSYRDTFSLLFKYCAVEKKLSPERMSLEMLDNDVIQGFLLWLDSERNSSLSTQNQRLAAIHTFFQVYSI